MKTLFIVSLFVSTLLTIVFAQNLEARVEESNAIFTAMNEKFDLAVNNAARTSPVVRDNDHTGHLVPYWLEPLVCSACH